MSRYLVKANVEGVADYVIESSFKYRFMAMKAVKIALKNNLMVRIIKVNED